MFRADLLTLRASTVAVDVDLELADLTDAALAGYGHARGDVVDTPPDAYPITGRWGQHVWDTTTCAGAVWNSRRSPDRLSFMLFVGAPAPPTAPGPWTACDCRSSRRPCPSTRVPGSPR